MELRAFAAPRHEDLWEDIRPRLAEEAARRGGTAGEVDGPYGKALHLVVPGVTPDGQQVTQPSTVLGIAGPRWLLRVSMFGRPAVQWDPTGARDARCAASWCTEAPRRWPRATRCPLVPRPPAPSGLGPAGLRGAYAGAHGHSRPRRAPLQPQRWANTTTDDARQLRDTTLKAGCCPIAEAGDRERVSIQGVLRTVTLRPRGGVPALEAELYDGSGADHPGLAGSPSDRRHRAGPRDPGPSAASALHDETRVMFNPRYELPLRMSPVRG